MPMAVCLVSHMSPAIAMVVMISQNHVVSTWYVMYNVLLSATKIDLVLIIMLFRCTDYSFHALLRYWKISHKHIHHCSFTHFQVNQKWGTYAIYNLDRLGLRVHIKKKVIFQMMLTLDIDFKESLLVLKGDWALRSEVNLLKLNIEAQESNCFVAQHFPFFQIRNASAFAANYGRMLRRTH